MFSKLKLLLASKEFQKFFVSGVLAFLLDFGLLNLQVYILKFQSVLFEVIFIPNVISTTAGITFNFLMQRYWTFNDREKDTAAKEGIKYLAVQFFNLVFFNGLVFGIIIQLGVLIPVAKIITNGLQMICSYILFKYFVFGSKMSSGK